MKLCDYLGGGRGSGSLGCTHTQHDAGVPSSPGMAEGVWVCVEAAAGASYL